MKILQVISSFPPAYAYGGALNVAFEISKGLVERGHEITVCTTDVFDSCSRLKCPINPIEIDGIEVYHFKNLSNKLAWRNLPIDPGFNGFLKNNIKNYNIIHLHEYRSFQAIIVNHYAKKYEVPYALQAHGSAPRVLEKRRMKTLFDIIWGNGLLRNATKIIALTSRESKQYLEMGIDKNKIKIVPNGIDLSKYDKLPEEGAFRRRYSIDPDERIVLSLSRIHKIKGIDLLVNSFANLDKELKNIRLVIVGPDGGFLPILKRQIDKLQLKEKVLITGPLIGESKLEAYVDADVYVLPSIYETFPMTVLESCACGTPVVVTDRCGIADIVENNAGYVVEYDQIKLQSALHRMLTDDTSRRILGRNAKNLVRNGFNWSVILDKYEKIYEDVISGNNS